MDKNRLVLFALLFVNTMVLSLFYHNTNNIDQPSTNWHSVANEDWVWPNTTLNYLLTNTTSDLMVLLKGASAKERSVAWRERRRFDSKEAAKEGYFATGPGNNLTPKDREILADLCFQSNSVFETGVGESTKICTFTGVPRLTAVDGSVDWLNNVMKEAPAHYRFHWADTGPIGAYSIPQNNRSSPKWPLASMAALATESEPFDLYVVDGRFRVASFAANMLHALQHGKLDALFALHDYPRRSHYHVVESIGKPVRGAGSNVDNQEALMAVFKMRDDITAERIIALWESHKGTVDR